MSKESLSNISSVDEVPKKPKKSIKDVLVRSIFGLLRTTTNKMESVATNIVERVEDIKDRDDSDYLPVKRVPKPINFTPAEAFYNNLMHEGELHPLIIEQASITRASKEVNDLPLEPHEKTTLIRSRAEFYTYEKCLKGVNIEDLCNLASSGPLHERMSLDNFRRAVIRLFEERMRCYVTPMTIAKYSKLPPYAISDSLCLDAIYVRNYIDDNGKDRVIPGRHDAFVHQDEDEVGTTEDDLNLKNNNDDLCEAGNEDDDDEDCLVTAV